jgi:hypothetical protein
MAGFEGEPLVVGVVGATITAPPECYAICNPTGGVEIAASGIALAYAAERGNTDPSTVQIDVFATCLGARMSSEPGPAHCAMIATCVVRPLVSEAEPDTGIDRPDYTI